MRRVLHPDDAAEVAEYVQSRGFKRVALQVPDGRLLRDAPLLASAVRAALAERRRRRRTAADADDKDDEEEELFILADTSANPLAVDEVAAAHVDAHCVVHFGPASLTRTSRTPALCVLPRRALPSTAGEAAGAGAAAAGEEGEESSGEGAEQQRMEAGARSLAALIAAQLREEAAEAVDGGGGDGGSPLPLRGAVVLLDQGYAYALGRVEAALTELFEEAGALPWPVAFARPLPRVLEPEEGALSLGGGARPSEEAATGVNAAASPPLLTGAGLQWTLPEGASRSDTLLLWVGPLVDPNASAAADAKNEDQDDNADAEEEDDRDAAAALAAAGPAAAPLARLQLVYADAPWRAFDPRLPPPHGNERGPARACQLLRRRRRFAVSAAHGAPMVGVLVGTLGAAGFCAAVAAVRALAIAAGKRPYTLLVGKPNPAKLANFPELGCFVHVTDPEGALLLAAQAGGGAGMGGGGGGGGGGAFLAPVVTPHEAAVAFGAAARGLDAHDAVALLESRPYSLGFDTVVREAEEVATLLAGHETGARAGAGSDGGEEEEGERALAAAACSSSGALAPVQAAEDILARADRAPGGPLALQPATAAEFLLLRRGYRGLETPVATGAPVKKAELASEGRLGRAAGYDDEGA